jgi:hypothetical protein
VTFCAQRVQTDRYGAIMATMTKSWTDERLEERFDSIDQRFDEVGRRFDSAERRTDVGFERVDAKLGELRGEMNTRFDCLESRFDAMQRTMLQFSGALIAVLVAALVGIFAQL